MREALGLVPFEDMRKHDQTMVLQYASESDFRGRRMETQDRPGVEDVVVHLSLEKSAVGGRAQGKRLLAVSDRSGSGDSNMKKTHLPTTVVEGPELSSPQVVKRHVFSLGCKPGATANDGDPSLAPLVSSCIRPRSQG